MKRFWDKVKKEMNGCWFWVGTINFDGYGVIGIDGKVVRTHRLSWELHNGKIIPKDMCVLHKCDIPRCVNPSHLFLGTRGDNNKDRSEKGRGIRGEAHRNSKLTEKDIAAIRGDKRSLRKICKDYGVSNQLISEIKRYKVWQHVKNGGE